MAKTSSFKFLDQRLARELLARLKQAKVDHSIDEDGMIHYSPSNGAMIENDLIGSVRDSVFPSWQVLTCPSDWADRYRDYMRRHEIPFREELSNGELWFLIPRKYRPHSWKLEEVPRKQPRLARSKGFRLRKIM